MKALLLFKCLTLSMISVQLVIGAPAGDTYKIPVTETQNTHESSQISSSSITVMNTDGTTDLVPATSTTSSLYSYFSRPYLSQISQSTQNTINTYKPFVQDGMRQSVDVGNDILDQMYNKGLETTKIGGQYAKDGLALGIGASVLMAQKSKEMLSQGDGAPNDYLKQTLNSHLMSASNIWENIAEGRRSVLELNTQKANQVLDNFDLYWVNLLRKYANHFNSSKVVANTQQGFTDEVMDSDANPNVDTDE